MTTTRPSRSIYMRNDPEQAWQDCESAYELGYVAGEADIWAELPAMTADEHSDLWGAESDYAEGYRDAYYDRKKGAGQ